MQHGDVFELLRDGIHSDPNALQPVGIFGKSQCWAVWLHDPSKDTPDPAPHLVLSPIHPRFWPFLLKFEMKLAGHEGAMAVAARLLAESGLNIHFGESSPSGHHHTTWNVVCEAVDVRRQFENKIQAFRRRKEHPSAVRGSLNQLADEVAEAMYQIAADTRERMLNQYIFEHPLIVTPGFYLLHRPDRLGLRGSAQRLACDDLPSAVRVRWIQTLPMFAFYGSSLGESHLLEWNPETSLLRSTTPGIAFSDILAEGNVTDLPTYAIASIHPEDYYVRLIPIGPAMNERLIQIKVHYEARFESSVVPATPAFKDASIDLWAAVCDHIRDFGVNLLQVSNTTTHRSANIKRGVLSITGVRQVKSSGQELMHLVSRIESLMESPGAGEDDYKLIVFPTCVRRANRNVFISWRRVFPHGQRLLELAEESARAWGLVPVFVDNAEGEDLTETVTSKIRQCDAFFLGRQN